MAYTVVLELVGLGISDADLFFLPIQEALAWGQTTLKGSPFKGLVSSRGRTKKPLQEPWPLGGVGLVSEIATQVRSRSPGTGEQGTSLGRGHSLSTR